VCVRAGQKATIGGSIAGLGKTYAIALQAINCQTGETLAREQAEAEDKEHVLKAVAKATTALRAKLGESLSSIQKTERMVGYTTNSLEALKAFQLGLDLLIHASSRDAIPQLRHATELDPNFATAHMLLGDAYHNTGQSVLMAESLGKAFALIDRVSEGERLMISGEYYRYAAHDLNKAIDALQMLVSSYPRVDVGHHSLGNAYSARGEYEKALEQHQESGRAQPRNLIFQGVLAADYINLDRFDEAKAVVERVFAQKPDDPGFHRLLLQIAYIQDDHAAQVREIQWAAGKPETFNFLGLQALNALMHGQRRKAKELYQDASEMARREGVAGVQSPTPAVIDAFVGDCEAAHKDKTPPALVICGDPAALKAADERDAKNPPENSDRVDLLYRRGEFQKILDHKGRNWGLYDSIAYLG
jgi:tetratricopeptide (TPR) repeat protein